MPSDAPSQARTPFDDAKNESNDGTPTEARVLAMPGEFLGPYRLVFELASGGMASIYAALAERRAGAHRLVAVKRLHPQWVHDPDYRRMFLDEALIASKIRHPNVCAVFDYGEHGGTPYIVMEYLVAEATSVIWKAVADVRQSDAKPRAALVARIVADACEALHAAHEVRSLDGQALNVVHRDVSPENLLVTYDGVVKLCDFGIAIASRQEHKTETGMLKGKYPYIQPEVLRGARPTRRSDIWSLGVVLWELLTGERLFRRATTLETLQAVAEALVPAPSVVAPGVPCQVDAVVLRALAANPEERFATAREFGMALDEAIAAAGLHAGIAEVSQWMERTFPAGRARKENLIELAAKLYEPAPASPSWVPGIRNDETEAPTIAMETRVAARRDHTGLGATPVPMLGSGTNARWRRSLATFACGAALGAGLFPAAQPPENSAQAAMKTEALGTRPARTRVEPVSCASAPEADVLAVPYAAAPDPNGDCDTKAEMPSSRCRDPRSSTQAGPFSDDLGAEQGRRSSTRSSSSGGASSARSNRARGSGSRRRPLNFQTNATLIVQDLELDPTLLAFPQMRLSRPDFVASTSGSSSASFPPPPR